MKVHIKSYFHFTFFEVSEKIKLHSFQLLGVDRFRENNTPTNLPLYYKLKEVKVQKFGGKVDIRKIEVITDNSSSIPFLGRKWQNLLFSFIYSLKKSNEEKAVVYMTFFLFLFFPLHFQTQKCSGNDSLNISSS